MSIKRTLKNKNLSKLQYEYNKGLKRISIRDKNNDTIGIDFSSFLKIKKIHHLDIHKKAQIVFEIQNENDNEDIENNFYILDRILKQTKKDISKRSMEWFSKEMTEDYIEYILSPVYKVTSKMTYLYVYHPQEDTLLEKLESMDDGDYVSCKIRLRGLRIYREDIVQEWELVDIQSEQEYHIQREAQESPEWMDLQEDLCNIQESSALVEPVTIQEDEYVETGEEQEEIPIEKEMETLKNIENTDEIKREEEGMEERLEERIEEGLEERLEERIEERLEERIEERLEERLEERIEQRLEEKKEKKKNKNKSEKRKEKEQKGKKKEMNSDSIVIKKKQKYISIAKR